MPIKEIARVMALSRNTVRAAVRREGPAALSAPSGWVGG
jgi:hypothetical protein